jgi:hypothetical protein
LSRPRDRLALRVPPASLDLTGFPRAGWRRTITLYRAHNTSHGVWWFSSTMDGRFDLAPPMGTCYLASSAGIALRERMGERLLTFGYLLRDEADQFVISVLTHEPSGAPRIADTAHAIAVQFGLSREISTTSRYRTTQRWAQAFFDAGFGGVRYEPRFATDPRARSIALFDEAGGSDPSSWPGWTIAEIITAASAAADAGIAIRALPRPSELTYRRPP